MDEWTDGWMDIHTAGADPSDWVAVDPFTTVTHRGTVEAELQGGTAAVTAGNDIKSHKLHHSFKRKSQCGVGCLHTLHTFYILFCA